jgi:hypothetical protein
MNGILFTELLNLPPGRVHRVAHAFAHRAKHREVRGVGQVVVFNERHGDIEGKARERYSRLRVEVPIRPSASSPPSPAPSSPPARDARLRVEVQLPHARARLGVTRRIIDHLGLCRSIAFHVMRYLHVFHDWIFVQKVVA